MKQLAIRGYSTVTPFRNEEQLKCVLCDLGVVEAFDATAVHELYYKIGGIIGAWLSEHESRDVSPVAKALLSVARHLTDASKLLSGRVSGFHTHVEIEVTSKTAEFLALDPTVGSLTKAQELISAFQQEASRLGHVCMVAYVDLTQEAGKGGRAPLSWYDSFTVLLLEIAHKAGVAPTLRKDRSKPGPKRLVVRCGTGFRVLPIPPDAVPQRRGMRKTPRA